MPLPCLWRRVTTTTSSLLAVGITDFRTILARLISEAWHTLSKIRRYPPTPVDELQWGFAVIEHFALVKLAALFGGAL